VIKRLVSLERQQSFDHEFLIDSGSPLLHHLSHRARPFTSIHRGAPAGSWWLPSGR
jgi:hypothetical protein